MRNVKPKKHLGQHFLNEDSISQSISNLICKTSKEVLEVGPGMGALTKFLIKKNINLKVIEIDIESINYLKKKYPNLFIIEENFLKLNLKEMDENVTIIGNFPYNISSQIIFKTYENKNKINELIGMFQKEVAERIVCEKGKKRGVLSVLIQSFYNVEYCFSVSPESFFPAPKVESGVIKLVRNDRLELSCNPKLFITVIKSGFSQKRKILGNALKNFNFKNKHSIEHLLKLRAEQLTVDNFIKITNHVV